MDVMVGMLKSHFLSATLVLTLSLLAHVLPYRTTLHVSEEEGLKSVQKHLLGFCYCKLFTSVGIKTKYYVTEEMGVFISTFINQSEVKRATTGVQNVINLCINVNVFLSVLTETLGSQACGYPALD